MENIKTANGGLILPIDISLTNAKGAIYVARHRDSGRVYIGMTSCSVAKRWKEHAGVIPQTNKQWYFACALRKYGAAAFDLFVIEQGLRPPLIQAREAYYVSLYSANVRGFGFNSSAGGEVAPSSDPRIGAKISASSMGKIITEKHRANLSKAMTGLERSHAHRENIGKAHRGKIVSAEARKNLSESHKGKKASAETKAKMSEAHRQRMARPGVRKKMSDAMKKRWAEPESRAKLTSALNAAFNSDEYLAKRREAAKNKQYTPELREKLRAAANRRWHPTKKV